jgi:hypothetical protein
LSGLEAITQVVAAKPDALERGWPLPGNQFEDGEALGAEKPGIAHFGDYRGHLSGAQLTNAAGIQPVFIAERQVIEQVFHRVYVLLLQPLGDPRAYALHVFNFCIEVQHLL